MNKRDQLLKEKRAGELLLLLQVIESSAIESVASLTHQSLADMLNKTRPTIKKYLSVLESYKLIKQEYGKIILLGDKNE